MNTLDVIAARHSYRGTYQNTPVPREHLVKILEAGCAAPSGCNKQTTSFIAVDDPKLMEELFSVIEKGLGKTAPAMICVLTQKIIAYRDRTYYVQDYAAAIQNMLLAIEDLGYASCWVEGHITDVDRIGDKMAAILGVPEGYELICYLPVGVAAEEYKLPQKKSFEDRAWFNGFGK
jgi:nitroreductase